MFPWRKRNDGFEWREYVRTTILVRRNDRRRRMEDAKDAAVASAKEAGQRGFGVAAGAATTGASLLLEILRLLAALPGRLWHRLAPVVGPASARALGALAAGLSRLVTPLDPVLSPLRGRGVRLLLLATLALGAIGAVSRLAQHGFDGEVRLALIMAAVAGLLLLLPALTDGSATHMLSRCAAVMRDALSRISGWRIPAAAAAVLGVGILSALAWLGGVPSLFKRSPGGSAIETASLGSRSLTGRASAVTGDTLRIAGMLVKLDGIEAPEPEQTCQRPTSGAWRCGEAARAALEKIVRSDKLECRSVGRSDAEMVACSTSGGEDIAGRLVRDGHVFASAGVFARYSALEREAREARNGLWFGDADRPADFRAQKWEEARRQAPDGCPIKGQVSARGRTYVLPWSASYDRVKVRETKGERWFCSEEEAQAAGWRATSRL